MTLLVLWGFSELEYLEVQYPHLGTILVRGHCDTNVKLVDNRATVDTRDSWPGEKAGQHTIGTFHSSPNSPQWKRACHFLMTSREEHDRDLGLGISERQSSSLTCPGSCLSAMGKVGL